MHPSEAPVPRAGAASAGEGTGPELLAAGARRGARWRVGIGAAVVLVLAAVAVAVVAGMAAPGASITELVASSAPTGGSRFTAAPTPEPTGLVVHVVGAVAHPGVYELPTGSRAIDAVAAAGGFSRGADKSAQNLARKLADGEQLYVPKTGESPPPAAVTEPGGTTTGSVGGGLVNLNTANETELETLPRVGPATAQKIIAWRESNGGFASVDDLQNVAGIGPKTFESLKALVTV